MASFDASLDLLLNGNKPKLTNFINNEFVEAEKCMPTVNPSTGKTWAYVPNSTASEVDSAVQAANAAFNGWSKTTINYRSKMLNKLADHLEVQLEKLAMIESRDQGKPVHLAKAIDIPRCVHNFRFFASAMLHHTAPSTLIDEPTRALNYVKYDPVGVAGLISPWNLPLYLLSFKMAPALAAGNTVVCKPSELTSATAWALMHAVKDVGFPPGVVNLVIGLGADAGEALVVHPSVPLISFTGSTAIGKHIAKQCASQNKKVSLEMGGKNAAIVYASANLERDIPLIARSCFLNQGEICLCTSRIFVQAPVYDELVTKLKEIAEKMTVGDPQGKNDLGAMNSQQHYEKVLRYIKIAENEQGVVKHCGGQLSLSGDLAEGYFISPTIVTGMEDSSELMKDEIFGPVVCITPFNTMEEAIARANDTPYGLSATVWSSDPQELLNTADAIRVGTVWCNTWMTRDLNMPFGGTKMSGTGREGAIDSLHFFTEAKTICVKL